MKIFIYILTLIASIGFATFIAFLPLPLTAMSFYSLLIFGVVFINIVGVIGSEVADINNKTKIK